MGEVDPGELVVGHIKGSPGTPFGFYLYPEESCYIDEKSPDPNKNNSFHGVMWFNGAVNHRFNHSQPTLHRESYGSV